VVRVGAEVYRANHIRDRAEAAAEVMVERVVLLLMEALLVMEAAAEAAAEYVRGPWEDLVVSLVEEEEVVVRLVGE